ncbi:MULTISPECIES: hypothetical protein [Leptospira]|uniref:Uncharacterized protein n=1 Tax=Leptospira interrogans str. UI 12621 TaxID=1049937 RepID=A0A0F6HFH5_LEPIR|nr:MULTISPECIES: hypothetical protein [Leptospira]EKO27123.1 hypothetical protein LEP1GSC104_1007 [Leptospira interrogans str. UI 12621]MCR8640094.1 hypothetical protein [Leptospira interrogans serovar Ricardi]
MIKILQFLLLVGILLFALNSFSQKKESITKYSASAYSRDDDLARTNIRDSPKGKILTSIPSGAMFEIIGYSISDHKYIL